MTLCLIFFLSLTLSFSVSLFLSRLFIPFFHLPVIPGSLLRGKYFLRAELVARAIKDSSAFVPLCVCTIYLITDFRL